MQCSEVSGAVRPLYGTLGVKGLNRRAHDIHTSSGIRTRDSNDRTAACYCNDENLKISRENVLSAEI